MIELRDVCKQYQKNGAEVCALSHVSLYVPAGALAAVVGPSGSGNTTLMNIVGCLDIPSSGEYLLSGRPVGSLRGARAAQLRSTHIGFVFQSFRLIPSLSALEN
ncbi:MAG: ATP-binding cassette domain-containing protein, partial [Clostridiaceae bacterium]|nr:ATP-binding cassette domain-containing protein [Clostridiaceae bacterium]